MLGVIIGDIVGSRFEFKNHRNKDFDLFTNKCKLTDDSIMSLAVAKAIMEALKKVTIRTTFIEQSTELSALLPNLTIRYMQQIGRKYPKCGFGGMFRKWVASPEPAPYNSYGNGAAMRVSPVGFISSKLEESAILSDLVTGVTHNHPEGIKGARATSAAILLSRNGYNKEEIRNHIIQNYYPLDFTIDEIRPTYKFNATCQQTVPQAIQCFLESTSFEDTIRTTISLGGDSDTLAAISGAIAEAYYGIPDDIKYRALQYIDPYLMQIYTEWIEFVAQPT